MDDVWVIIVGEYSDQQILAVFDTRPRAEAYRSQVAADEMIHMFQSRMEHLLPSRIHDQYPDRYWDYIIGGYHIERYDFNPPLPSEVRKVTNGG